jgi:regulator of RNase E activity RraA
MVSIKSVSSSVLEQLRRFDTPTVCNVVELFDLRPRTAGYMDARIRACFPKLPPMVGYAATATFRSAAPPASGNVYAGMADQLVSFGELPSPPVVVFQDLDNPVASATFGEVMATTYQSFGAVGLVTSGAGRDLDQVEALAFPCFCDGTICAHGYCHIVQVNVPIHIGGVMVHPCDILHGDRNGVTTIPNHIASAVAEACPEYMAAEAVVLDFLKKGGTDSKKFTDARNECHHRIEALAKRLKNG